MVPFLAYALLYVAGILVGGSLPLPPLPVFVVCLPVLLALAMGLAAWRHRLRLAAHAGVVLAVLAGALGQSTALTPGEWDPSHLPAGTEVALHGALVSDLSPTRYTTRTVLRVWAGKVGDEVHPLRGTVVVEAVHPPVDDAREEAAPEPLRRSVPRAGDEVVVVGRIAPLRQAARSGLGGFSQDERRYGAFSRVRHAAVVSVDRVGLPSQGDLRYALLARNRSLCPTWRDGLVADVMLSMVFGSSSLQMEPAALDAFRRAGTVHVLVVSGAQLGAVAALTAWLSGRLRSSRLWALGLPIVAAVCYALLLPSDGGILRAMVLLGALYVGRLLQRDPDVVVSVALAAFLILLAVPGRLWDLSLQLSVLAVLGVIFGVRFLADDRGRRGRRSRWGVVKRAARGTIAASIGATLATAPLLAARFGSVALAAPVSNLVSVPIAAVLTIMVLVSTPLAWIAPPLARGLNVASGVLAEGLIRVTEGVPWPWVQVSLPSTAMVAIYTGLTALVWWGEGRRRRRARLGADGEEPPAEGPKHTGR